MTRPSLDEMRKKSPPCANCGSFEHIKTEPLNGDVKYGGVDWLPLCASCHSKRFKLPRKSMKKNRFFLILKHSDPKALNQDSPWVDISN